MYAKKKEEETTSINKEVNKKVNKEVLIFAGNERKEFDKKVHNVGFAIADKIYNDLKKDS